MQAKPKWSWASADQARRRWPSRLHQQDIYKAYDPISRSFPSARKGSKQQGQRKAKNQERENGFVASKRCCCIISKRWHNRRNRQRQEIESAVYMMVKTAGAAVWRDVKKGGMTSLAGANVHLHHNVHADDSMTQAADDWECQLHGVPR